MSDERVDIINPQGELVTVPKSQYDAALAQGFQAPNATQQRESTLREKYGTGVGTELRAGAEGAARGITFGLSDVAAGALGADKEGLRERKARNPYSAGIGEAAGIGAGLLLPTGIVGAGVKGAAAAGELGARGAASLLTRAGVEGGTIASQALASGVKAATGSAIEGALYGAGQGVSEAALGDPADAAEKILAHATMGALLGGGLGGAAGALGGVGSKALQKLARPAAVDSEGGVAQQALSSAGESKPANLVSEFLNDVAGEQALRAAGLPKSAFKKLQRKVGVLPEAGDEAATAAAEQVELRDVAAKTMRENRLAQVGDTFEDVGNRVENHIGEKSQQAKSLIAKADGAAEAPLVDLGNYSKRLREYAKKYENQPEQQAEYEQLLKRADAYDTLAEKSGGNVTLAQAEELKRGFDGAMSATGTSAAKQIARESRGMFNAEIESSAKGAMEPADFAAWKRAKREMEALIPVLEGNKNKLQTLTANRTLSLTDQLAGLTGLGSIGVNPLGFAGGLAMAGANKIAREYGSAAISDYAARAAQGLGAQRGAQALQLLHIERTKNAMTERLQSAAQGIASSLGQAPKAVTPLSVVGMDKLTMLPEQKADDSKAVTHDLHNRVTELTNLAGNPQMLQARLEESMGDLPQFAPRVAAQMHLTAAEAVNYLADKVPQNPYPDAPLNVRQAWRPPQTQMVAFERTLRAIHDPIGTIEEFRDGHVTKEGADALRAVYPTMYAKLVEHIVPAVVNAPKVPLQRRLQLANMLGTEMDVFTSAAFAASMQQVYAAAGQAASPPPRPAVSKNIRAKQSETPMQRALNGET